jgi:AraC family transcriptional regulator, arabinose operon regulatory protein
MHYLAMANPPRKRREAPIPLYDRILTGHFHPKARYSVARSHGTPDWLGIYTLSGQGRVGTPVSQEQAVAGDFFLITPGTPHDYGLWSSGMPWNFLWAHFLPPTRWLNWLQWPESGPGTFRVQVPRGPVRREVEASLQNMHAASLIGHLLSNDMAMNALESALLKCTHLVWKEAEPVDDRVRRAADYLAENLASGFSLSTVAKTSGLSMYRLAHLFHEQIGETPRRYHERLRLERAGELLRRTSNSVAEISRSLGYESEFYFSRRFKQKTGSSPRSYRKFSPRA